ncbi:putative mitochondrial protein AtMg00310 [Apium graveolens]|uniref:putative mitochondrial protein AtMg00310 n=1 Tax=Apium graveolens TaxID=4045 RepID=UPI003D7A649C
MTFSFLGVRVQQQQLKGGQNKLLSKVGKVTLLKIAAQVVPNFWMNLFLLPVEDGGMGFKKLRSFNVAMLAKQAWRLINNTNPLVTQLMCARYFPTSDFLNVKLGVNPSFVWKSILESQEVVRQGCRRRI